MGSLTSVLGSCGKPIILEGKLSTDNWKYRLLTDRVSTKLQWLLCMCHTESLKPLRLFSRCIIMSHLEECLGTTPNWKPGSQYHATSSHNCAGASVGGLVYVFPLQKNETQASGLGRESGGHGTPGPGWFHFSRGTGCGSEAAVREMPASLQEGREGSNGRPKFKPNAWLSHLPRISLSPFYSVTHILLRVEFRGKPPVCPFPGCCAVPQSCCSFPVVFFLEGEQWLLFPLLFRRVSALVRTS